MVRLRLPPLLRWLLPAFVLVSLALAVPNDPTLPCLPAGATACATCHAKDLQERFPAHRNHPCTTYCLKCHFKDAKEEHHSVGTPLRRKPKDGRLVTVGDRLGCATCHDLATPRYAEARWKAESLFDRMFRSQDRYKTYLLVYRNDKGQLCLACH